MIPSWAKVGGKVVCVDADMYPVESPLASGHIYTVAKVLRHKGARAGKYQKPCLAISLGEVDNPWDLTENAFALDRFRPLVTLEDDMKLFEHLRNPSLVDKLDLLAERMNELAAD